MTRFVKLITTARKPIWINPDALALARASLVSDNDTTLVYHDGSTHDVIGTPEGIVVQLEVKS